MTDKTQDERLSSRDEDDSPDVEGHRLVAGAEDPGKAAARGDDLPGDEGEQKTR